MQPPWWPPPRRAVSTCAQQRRASCSSVFTHLHRLLGKELLVLVWAIEEADPGTIDTALQNWLGLRPEERWWLYSKTAAEAGEADQRDKGWRKALYCMLSDGSNIRLTIQENAKRKQIESSASVKLIEVQDGVRLNIKNGTIIGLVLNKKIKDY